MQRKQGISLIVLVITIIVMIILAAAIILSLNNAGIIGNANKAVSETDYKNVQTAAQLVYADMMLSETEKPSMMLKQGEYIKQKLIAQGTITESQAEMYRFKNNGEVVKLQTKAEYETMYKDELAMLDSSYYTITDGVFSLNNVNDLENLTVLAIPYGVTKIDISSNAGEKCKNVTKIIMPDTITEWKSVGVLSFRAVEQIVFSKKLNRINTNFAGTEWFRNNKKNGCIIIENILVHVDNNVNIKEVIIPNSVEIIEEYVIVGTYIEKITIPSTVEYIADSAFALPCISNDFTNKLKEINFMGVVPEIGNYAFAFRDNISQEMKDKILEKNSTAFDNSCII